MGNAVEGVEVEGFNPLRRPRVLWQLKRKQVREAGKSWVSLTIGLTGCPESPSTLQSLLGFGIKGLGRVDR